MTRQRPSVFCFAIAVAALPAVSLADTIYSDGTFNLSNYTNPFTYQNGPISGVYFQCSSCGDPGQALSTTVTLTTATSASSNLDIGLLNSNFIYNPAVQGTVLSVNASVDSSTSISLDVSEYNSFDPLIEQDGSFYYAQLLSGPGNSGFVNLASTFSASSFVQFDPITGLTNSGSHPNFAGDPMDFGIMISSGSIALPSFTQTLVYDNLSFDITAIPEPASLLLVGAVLAGLAVLRRREREWPGACREYRRSHWKTFTG
jgi:hypothetical protein